MERAIERLPDPIPDAQSQHISRSSSSEHASSSGENTLTNETPGEHTDKSSYKKASGREDFLDSE